MIAVLPNGEEVEATLFFWHSPTDDENEKEMMEEDPVFRCHGLVVASDDKQALEDARMKCEEMRLFI